MKQYNLGDNSARLPISKNNNEKVEDIVFTLQLLGVNIDSFSYLLDKLPVYFWVHDENNKIVYGNHHFKENFGSCINQPCYQCLMGEKKPCDCCLSSKSLEKNKTERCMMCKRGNAGYDINIFHTPITNKSGQRFTLKSSFHINDLGIFAVKAVTQQQREVEEQQLFLTMCSACNKVKDHENNWVAIDDDILNYFDIRISHGICPECTDILYPGLIKKNKSDSIQTKQLHSHKES